MDNNSLTNVKAGITAILATLTAFWGWFGWLVIVWVCMMLLDWLIGSAAAAKQGKWSSAKLRAGAWHKGGEVVIVIVALVADWLIGLIVANIPGIKLPFEYSVLVCPLVLCWYIVTELGSICENAAALGAPLPGFLKKILAVVKNSTEDVGESLTGGKTE